MKHSGRLYRFSVYVAILLAGCGDETPQSQADAGAATAEDTGTAGADATPDVGTCDPTQCDDANPCTKEECAAGACVNTPLVGATCDDGNACTQESACTVDGQCVGAESVFCDDGDACTADTCDTALGCVFEPLAEGSPCDDGDACTVGDTCQAGGCKGVAVECEEDDNECTVLAGCSKTTGDCEHKTVANGTPCEDGNLCTINETCKSGICNPGGPKGCDDGIPCTQDSCEPKSGCVYAPVPLANLACDDNNKCTTNDVCAFAKCLGTPISCDDGNTCTEDTCEITTGCAYSPLSAPCDDGDPCTKNDICKDGECAGKEIACPEPGPCQIAACEAGKCETTAKVGPCDDGNACTTGDTCGAGGCVGTPVTCDDSNPCTDDSCDPAGGCKHVPNAVACDDGDACTGPDVCKDGGCTGASVCVCETDADCVGEDDGNLCNGTKQCVAGKCVDKPGSVVTCDQTGAGACQVATCDPATGECTIAAAPDGDPCDDGTECTTPDTCQAGTCQGTAAKCDDGNECTDDTCDDADGCKNTPNEDLCDDGDACTVGDTCDGGACTPGAAAACDDANPCTTDGCEAASGCTHQNNTEACEDGDACTEGDACEAGACAPGAEVACDDGNPCADDACHATLGCQVTNNEDPCDDGDTCTSGDVCGAGVCQPGSPADCDDANPCTDDVCDAQAGCQYTINQGMPCTDGDECTVADECEAGACKPGTALVCDDGNPCTDDTCDESIGCQTQYNQDPCEDGDACTEADTCSGGSCVAGPAADCTDANPCTDDSCDPLAGCQYAYNLAPCSDGDACTETDVCVQGECVAGEDLSCDDQDPCTDDACDPDVGCMYAANTAPCEDGDPCTVGDACASQTCKPGQPLDCNDNNPCTTDACGVGGVCASTPTSLPCDDGDPCTKDDVCGSQGVCVGHAAEGSWIAAAAVPRKRLNHTATVLADGRVLVAGGSEGSSQNGTADLFDPYTNSWSQVGNMNAARDIHVAARLADGRVMIAGGRQGGSPIGLPEIYDPKSKTWSATASIPARYGHGMVTLDDGKVLVFGGYGSYQDVRLFDPATDSWAQQQSMLAGRHTFIYTRLADGRVLAAGGEDPSGNTLSSAEIFDPMTGKWTWTASDMNHARRGTGTTGVLLPDGTVLVTGGFDGDLVMHHPELYDPETDTWSEAPQNVFPRISSAVLLPSGMVLLAGGVYYESGTFNYTSLAEVFSPQADAWSSVAPLATVRSGHTVSVLQDGRALLVGGTISPSVATGTTDALIFDPGCSVETPPASCAHVLATDPGSESGVYVIDPDQEGPVAPFEVYCDMELDGGGWTLVAVSSDDGQDTWTWNNRHYWDTDTTTFGSLNDLHKDYKSWALHSIPFSDIAFVHAPSGAWASYHDVADGTTSLSVLIQQVGEKCWTPGAGWTLTAGDLGGATGLCDTHLYFNARDYDGQQNCSTTTATQNTYGPVWSASWNDPCPFDDPAGRALGPVSNSPDSELYISAENIGMLGFGFTSKDQNTGVKGSATNYMWVLVRHTLDQCYGLLDGTPCDDGNPNTTSESCDSGTCQAEMVQVEAGSYWMGCNPAVFGVCDNETVPAHAVTTAAYQIDITEVTAAAYGKCVDLGGCTPPSENGFCSPAQHGTYGVKDKAHHPINCVNWMQANSYCAWRGKRLCSESEWEKAARGGCDHYPGVPCDEAMPKFPWGNATATCEYAVMDDGGYGCGTGLTWPVGSKPLGAGPYGALDMSGNVAEWVSDCWHETYDGAPTDGSSWSMGCAGAEFVFRSGSYDDSALMNTAMDRGGALSQSNRLLGFRCCADPDWSALPEDPCSGQPDGAPCSDGDPETVGDQCVAGQCVAGSSICPEGLCFADNVLDLPADGASLTAAAPGCSQVELPGGVADYSTLEPGDILLSRHGEGFVCRVESVSSGPDGTLVIATPATLEDALVVGSIRQEATIAFADPETPSAFPMAAPMAAPVAPLGASGGVAGDGKVVIIPAQTLFVGSEGGSGVEFKILQGSVGFFPSVQFDVDWGLTGIKHVRFQAYGTLSYTFGAEVHLTGAIPFLDKKKMIWKGVPVALPGPVPIFVEPSLEIGIEGKAGGEVGYSTEYTGAKYLSYGVRWDKGVGWSLIKEPVGTSSVVTGPSLFMDATAELVAKIGPKLALKIAGVAGPTLGASLKGKLKGAFDFFDFMIDWSMELCVAATAGGELSILSLTLAHFEFDIFEVCGILKSGSTCVDECTAQTAPVCNGASTVIVCLPNLDGDKCLDWSETKCTAGFSCVAGACVADCASNFCQDNGYGSGSFCSGSQKITCSTSGGCKVATAQSCPSGCSSGQCISCSSNFCQNNGFGSGNHCSGDQLVSCSTSGSCYVVSNTTTCPAGCSGSQCTTCPSNFCQNNGFSSGAHCNGNQLVSCTTSGGCYSVSNTTNCPNGCSGNQCTSCPSNFCQNNGFGSGAHCSGSDLVTCTTSSGCYGVSGTTSCPNGCSGSQCTSCPSNFCQSSGYGSGTHCNGTTSVTCQTNGNGCKASAGEQYCSNGCDSASGQCKSASCGLPGESCCSGTCIFDLPCVSGVCYDEPTYNTATRYVSLCNSAHWQSTSSCWPGDTATTGCGCTPTVSSCFGTKTCWQEESSFNAYQSKPSFGSFFLVHHCFEGGANKYSKSGCTTPGVPATLGYISSTSISKWSTPVWLCQWQTGGVVEQFFTFAKSECSAAGGSIVLGDPFGYVWK